ncbi:MAG TPA: RHS repeat-associated core domain-containing protein [Candidatus Udaeobacter sp.]|nr:RHS repeat-associated core domain-containing protein [Candidatus Udaeobacter sp.]
MTYTAVVPNPTDTFAMGGNIDVEANADATATIAYYWDQLEICGTGCGDGTAMNNPHWTAVATFESSLPAYQPVQPPALHSGLALVAQSVARAGVTYPSGGDAFLGTQISPAATATWTYVARVVLTPAQEAVVADPLQASSIRNVIHFEATSRNTSAAQPYTDPEPFSNPFLSSPNPGAVSNVTVTFTLPDGTKTAVGPSAVPALGTLAPGASATATAQFKVPVPGARGSAETEAAYSSRLGALDGAALTATAVAAGTGFSGNVYATPAPVSTTEHVPIVTISKSGPAQVNAGDVETNPLALQNLGGAGASSIAVNDTVPAGSGTVSGAPTSLAPAASGSATATYSVPISQAEGDLTDIASVTWKDANGNPYGSLSSSFTTHVHNVLFGARLTLAPAVAGPNPPGTSQTLTATLLDRNGNPIANQTVTFTISGANVASGTATTDSSGNAPFSYSGANSGTDVATATVTAPGITLTSNTATISWGKLLQPVVTSQVQGNFFPNPNDSCTFGAGPNSAPVFQQAFPDILFNADASFVPHDISTVNSGTRPFTDLTVDVNGNYNGQVIAAGNGLQAGTGSLNSFYAEFSGSFVVAQAGDVTFTIVHDDGYLLGVGNGATRVNGDYEGNPPATTPFNGYPTVAAFDQGGAGTGSATIHFPAPGTYPYELDYTECGGGGLRLILETAQFIAQTDPLSIYVGYADGLRAGGSIFPFPWQGSPNVTFIGGCTFDAGAIRFDNSGSTDITFDKVTVNITGAPLLDIWPSNLVVPAHGILILTQTGCFNFDTSDFSGAGCGGNNGVLPLVNVVRGGVTTTYTDTHQVLNTRGFDLACQGNESTPWQRIAGQASTVNVPLPPAASLDLTPFNVTGATQGQSQTFTVSALDGAGNPVSSLPISLQVFGANAQTVNGTTGLNGLATFTYTGALAGSDTLQASAFILGQREISNQGSIVWTAPGGGGGGLGPSITSPTPADGTIVTKPVAVDATIAAPSGHSITGWRVFYQTAGGPQVVIGQGSGAPPSPLGVTFDPTVLVDGGYTLTVEATADDGAVQQVSSGISVYGALKLGRYTTSFRDLAVPVTGYAMQVLRTYDSTDMSNGDFGIGWHVDVSNFSISTNHLLGAGGWTMYDSSCVLGLCLTAYKNSAPRFVSVRFPDGHVEVFDLTPDGGTNLFWTCTPKFTVRASLGTTSTLVPVDDIACSYTGDGNLYGSNGVYNPQRFQLTTRNGEVFLLDAKLGLISMTDRNGNKLSVDATGVHSSAGPSINFTRDGSGRITAISGPSGQALKYTYSATGDLTSSTDPDGNVDTYIYDAGHRLLKVSGPLGALSSQTYDSSGRLSSITDASGHTTQITSDPSGQTTTVTDPLGATTTVLTADGLGDIVRSVTTSGGATHSEAFVYDAIGHIVQKTDENGNSVRATYDAQGGLASYADALGNTTNFTYDSFGDVTSVTGPNGGLLLSVIYDANGNPTSITEPGGVVQHLAYDGSGHVMTRTDGGGNDTSYTYDGAGHLTAVTPASGGSIHIAYDASGRTTSITDSLGGTIAYSYDGNGDVVGSTDGMGSTQSFTYDALGDLTSATDALGIKASAAYTADGRMTSTTDRNGIVTTFTYDADGRITRTGYSDGDFTTYAYDGFGRPVTIANGSSSIDSIYDAAGHVLSSTTHSSAFGAVTLSYTYDAAGNRLSVTGPDGAVSYAYNSQGRLVKVTDPSGGVFGFQYSAASQVTGLTRPNGVTDQYTYDVNGKLNQIVSSLGATTVQALSRTFAANGLVSSRTDGAGTASFTHDAAGRLVAVSGPGSSSQAYAYDAAGNRISSPESSSSTFNAADELTAAQNAVYTYDANGRRTSKVDSSGGVTRYTYNARGQLVSIAFPDGTSSSYTYDALGRRLSSTSGSSTTSYVYDGANTRLEYSGSALAASYVGTGMPDQTLEMNRAGAQYYYLDDFQGSVTAVTDASGAVKSTYSYDAFGLPTGATSVLPNPFTYTGREFDPKSGLYYNRARYYDPGTGSFLSRDPAPSSNPYPYALNDPVDFTDQSGMQAEVDAAILTRSAAARSQAMRMIGCGLALITSSIEVEFSLAAHLPATSDIIAMILGTVAGCALGALSANVGPLSQVAGYPMLGAFVAAAIDLVTQWVCATNSGHPEQLNVNRVLAVGLAGLSVGAITGVVGIMFPPEATPVVISIEFALLAGEYAAVLDKMTPAGASC